VAANLEELFDSFLSELTASEGSSLLLLPEFWGSVPSLIRSRDLRAEVAEVYDVGRSDTIEIWAGSNTLRRFAGLLIATALVPGPHQVEVDLAATRGGVRRIRLSMSDHAPVGLRKCRSGDDPCLREYWTRLTHFRYQPGRGLRPSEDSESRPFAQFVRDGGPRGADIDLWWKERDTIIGFGSAVACLSLAGGLLDFADGNAQSMSVYGDRSDGMLKPGSAEMKFYCRDRIPDYEWPEAADSARDT
jgi:hypothetical protein